MSHRAVRVTETARVERFAYHDAAVGRSGALAPATVAPRSVQVVAPGRGGALPMTAPAFGSTDRREGAAPEPALNEPGNEREAFAQGYAQGERAGVDVAARQLRQVHDRLGQTLERLASLRDELTYRTERDVVELALAVATRILHREVSLDREILLVMARIALDRMGDTTTATIRLHPDDEAAARGARDAWPGGSVAIVADPAIHPGGCVVQTDRGLVEVGVDAQVKELATALLGDEPVTARVTTP